MIRTFHTKRDGAFFSSFIAIDNKNNTNIPAREICDALIQVRC